MNAKCFPFIITRNMISILPFFIHDQLLGTASTLHISLNEVPFILPFKAHEVMNTCTNSTLPEELRSVRMTRGRRRAHLRCTNLPVTLEIQQNVLFLLSYCKNDNI